MMVTLVASWLSLLACLQQVQRQLVLLPNLSFLVELPGSTRRVAEAEYDDDKTMKMVVAA